MAIRKKLVPERKSNGGAMPKERVLRQRQNVSRVRWIPYQLADDPTEYGPNASKWIVTTANGEHEVLSTPMSEREANGIANVHNREMLRSRIPDDIRFAFKANWTGSDGALSDALDDFYHDIRETLKQILEKDIQGVSDDALRGVLDSLDDYISNHYFD